MRTLLEASLGIFSERYFMDPQRGGFLQRGSEYKKLENLYEQENAGN